MDTKKPAGAGKGAWEMEENFSIPPSTFLFEAEHEEYVKQEAEKIVSLLDGKKFYEVAAIMSRVNSIIDSLSKTSILQCNFEKKD